MANTQGRQTGLQVESLIHTFLDVIIIPICGWVFQLLESNTLIAVRITQVKLGN